MGAVAEQRNLWRRECRTPGCRNEPTDSGLCRSCAARPGGLARGQQQRAEAAERRREAGESALMRGMRRYADMRAKAEDLLPITVYVSRAELERALREAGGEV